MIASRDRIGIHRFHYLLFAVGFVLVAVAATAQVQRDELNAFVQLHSAESERLRAEAESRARQLGLPIRQNLANGATVALKRFVDGRPLYYLTDNLNAARTVSTDLVWAGGGLGLFLDGSGRTLGIWDGGSVRGTHVELSGRVVSLDGAGLSGHATHVGGTMIATGVDANARGMSFAGILRSYDFNGDEPEMAAEQLLPDPITVSNHSYSFISGWIFNFFSDGRWVWFGDVAVKFTPGKAGGLSSVSPSKGPKLAPPKGGCLANPAPCSTNRG